MRDMYHVASHVPTMRELDLIARASLTAARIAPSLKPGQAIHVAREQLDAMNAWAHDARAVGFTGTDAGWAWQGHPIKASGL